MNWLDIWGPATVASIVGVIAAAAFTWIFNIRTDQEHKRGVRALVSQELLHNDAALRTLIGGLIQILQNGGGYARAFRAMPRSTHWQHTRWELPDVGSAFTPEQLTRYSEWYFGLDGVTFLYEQLMAEVLEMVRPDPPNVHRVGYPFFEEDASIREQLARIIDYAQTLLENRPPVPDKRLDSDPSMERYVRELQARSDSTSAETSTDSAQ